jgi:23S rRNA (pseudouridine1915-N3)-methyltransferase
MALTVHVLAVGKIKERGLREVIDDYVSRIGRYAQVHEASLKDGSEAEVRARFEKAIPERAKVVALEVDGKALTSEGLARLVGQVEDSTTPHLAFLIGGAYGLPRAVSDGAHIKLSLSAMILPHRIARLVLVEQVYRAFTILRGEPYSHG